jgi:hypothetical protein
MRSVTQGESAKFIVISTTLQIESLDLVCEECYTEQVNALEKKLCVEHTCI